MARRARTLFFLLLHLGALLPAPASAQTEALEGWIVFTSNRDGDYEIYKKRADSSGPAIQLTHNEVMDYEPVWSPSGRRIAFTRRSSGDIYTMWADGTHVRRRTPSSNDDSQPAWSPDGRHIAYSSFWGDGCDILMFELGGERSDLYSSSEAACNRQPDWSPDGSRVVFTETNFNEASVFILDVASRDMTEVVVSDGMYPSRPRWSPDGEFILYGALDDPEVTDPVWWWTGIFELPECGLRRKPLEPLRLATRPHR